MKVPAVLLAGLCLSAFLGVPQAKARTVRPVKPSVPYGVPVKVSSPPTGQEEKSLLSLKVNGRQVLVRWEDSRTIQALVARVKEGPIQIHTERYGQFEQVGQFPFNLPSSDVYGAAKPGDIMLYQGEHMVLFFGEHAWSYTKLGAITGMGTGELQRLLDRPEAQIELTTDD